MRKAGHLVTSGGSRLAVLHTRRRLATSPQPAGSRGEPAGLQGGRTVRGACPSCVWGPSGWAQGGGPGFVLPWVEGNWARPRGGRSGPWAALGAADPRAGRTGVWGSGSRTHSEDRAAEYAERCLRVTLSSASPRGGGGTWAPGAGQQPPSLSLSPAKM